MNDFITTLERGDLFEILCHEAAACRVCPRLADHTAVMGRCNGTLIPKVLFVGEAPGRLGADRTRRPFTGDQSGARFDELLASIDLSRDEAFITNAVLCCPADDAHNFTPAISEVRNCGRFLRRTLDLLAPPVVATLGAVALRAVGRLIDRPLVLADTAGTIIECDEFLLVPLYHPSPRVLRTVRSFEQQKADFAAVREAIAFTTVAV
ncbi:MAG: uracil-DNA glycosylase [Planctomycetes bacterium]|nr:uracil-DNA glycosylase [Planctomycetota bacterium]